VRLYHPALLFSGGLDSFIAWRLREREVDPLYVRMGHRYQARELATLERIADRFPGFYCRPVDVLSLGKLEQSDGYIPMRNLLLATTAVALGYREVRLTALRGEASRDKSHKFEKDTSALLTYLAGEPVTVALRYRSLTKRQLVRKYLDAGFRADELRLTRSCYADTDVPCGQCQACFRRWVAMSLNGIEEDYAIHPSRRLEDKAWAQTAWRALRKADPREWPGMAANNFDAWLALQRAHREGRGVAGTCRRSPCAAQGGDGSASELGPRRRPYPNAGRFGRGRAGTA